MDDTGRTTKVARGIDKYGLEGIGAELEAAWTGEKGNRTSLRDLADEFNQALLEGALQAADGPVIQTDIENGYRILTDESVPQGDRLRKRRELEQRGVDVTAVVDDFVTHQTIHTYLTSERGATLPDDDTDRITQKTQTIDRLRGRLTAVANSTIDALIGTDDITDRPYEVFVDLRVACSACGADYPISELLRQGGCDCPED